MRSHILLQITQHIKRRGPRKFIVSTNPKAQQLKIEWKLVRAEHESCTATTPKIHTASKTRSHSSPTTASPNPLLGYYNNFFAFTSFFLACLLLLLLFLHFTLPHFASPSFVYYRYVCPLASCECASKWHCCFCCCYYFSDAERICCLWFFAYPHPIGGFIGGAAECVAHIKTPANAKCLS